MEFVIKAIIGGIIIATVSTVSEKYPTIGAFILGIPLASRCLHDENLNDPIELYTYGSPRVGWRKYVKSLGVTHHRWVNNNDIVTGVPLWLMGYVHHGEKHYLNAYGKVRNPSGWQLFKDRMREMM